MPPEFTYLGVFAGRSFHYFRSPLRGVYGTPRYGSPRYGSPRYATPRLAALRVCVRGASETGSQYAMHETYSFLVRLCCFAFSVLAEGGPCLAEPCLALLSRGSELGAFVVGSLSSNNVAGNKTDRDVRSLIVRE